MQIGGLQKLSLIDYPGKLACTVFFVGCPFRCPWCYNPRMVVPERIQDQPKMPIKDFLAFLQKRKGALDGVVLGGGEPTINPELPDLCRAIRKMGYNLKLDTNGSNPSMLKNLIKNNLLDYVAMDVKATKEKYLMTIGLGDRLAGLGETRSKIWGDKILENVQESIDFLKQNNNVDYEFRTTVIPGLLTRKDIFQIAKWISPTKKYFLQDFQSGDTVNPKFEYKKPYEREYLLEILRLIQPFFETCELRAD